MPPQSRELLDLDAALRNQYVLERELGRGGMGVVFLARDLKLDRYVAIKALPAYLADDERVRERFLREARTAARLSHPNIVPIHRADEIDGRVFFVMGYVDGESLAQRVAERGPLPPAEVTPLIRDVAEALHEAHLHGIVHRDVKAENILIDRRTGRAMVTDFGIARVLEAAPLTATGLMLGTVHYMSPEQVVGEDVDGRSDVYALGVVAFYALTGRFPFQSESASAVLVAHVTKVAPKVRDVDATIPEPIADVVDRCLRKDPAERPATAQEVAVALGAIPRTPTVTPARHSGRPPRPGPAPPVFLSDVEARGVWERAAQLQANATGRMARVIPAKTADRSEVSDSSAYRLDVVRDAAREAGIGTQYVDRALAERGLDHGEAAPEASLNVAPASTAAADVRDLRLKPASPWAGAPLSIDYETTVPGELSERDFDRVVEQVRYALGEVGTVSGVGQTLTWNSTDQKRPIQVYVQMRRGQTTIRVREQLRALAGSVFGGGVGGFGGGFGGAVFGLLMGAMDGRVLIAFGAYATIAAIAYAGARMVYRRSVRSRERELTALLERLAGEVSASIEERLDDRQRPALPRR
jgi:serine/threonine protein kinase